MNHFTYHWMHIPTGRRGVTNFDNTQYKPLDPAIGVPRKDALELVNKWNAQSPVFWKYWL